MTTLDMEIQLMKHFDIRRNLIIPNVTDWSTLLRFEADLLILSRCNYATVIEIKNTKADLRKDLKKRHISTLITHPKWKEAYYGALKYFSYAVPERLKEDALNQIPDFAGLITLHEPKRNSNWDDGVTVERKPKILFRYKWTDEMRYKLARLGAMRILKYKEKLNSYKT